MDLKDIPSLTVERVTMMESILIASATGGSNDGWIYEYLRREFIRDTSISVLLPTFVRTHRTLNAFWPYIKEQAGTYAERRKIISDAFTPLIDYLEGVHAVWEKAIARRSTDPEGAITVARTLLETVSKRILDETGNTYSEKDDLPKIYSSAASALNLAPDQHTEEPIKAI